ncbi:hypothetical protein VCB84_002587 [Providencia rettgeri]|uniref:Replication initiation protein n=1 Tax=Providencia rettgeri TaxID=587 RepID=A0AAW6UD28_PRORE|nr:hypothetical protein [Providencia rettgeri]ELR5060069.1 hypothetical protein [Providencia rettgeri]ELR5235857.1 hypothetical protein [Providencia rettgeri]ELU1336752.1 hypothetical protein [Providencia rettgeri]EMC2741985.1 hypothetical protein [Providencia rettgeri]EMD6656627.1 hypothetical protein [Providencia rettgeri]
MEKCLEVNSIREGVYLLWRLKYTEEAQQFAFNTTKNTQDINDRINTLIDEKLTQQDGDAQIIRDALRFLHLFRRRQIDESQLTWLKRSPQASLYVWLGLIQEHIVIHGHERFLPRKRYDRKRRIRLAYDRLASVIPNCAEDTYHAALSLLDILPYRLEEKNRWVSRLRQDYFNHHLKYQADFAWLDNTEATHIHWVMDQFAQHRYLLRPFRGINLPLDLQSLAVPLFYSLWDEHPDTKALFLTALRKRYANMKHRQKVADKSPINIRVSENSKKTLLKLEKQFNRSRAEVIEYLIEKAWAERNTKI